MTLTIDFLYLGGDKCGSTWVHHILDRHPDVALARAKELFYFDRFYDKGPEWYLRRFPARDGRMRIGEICHDYLYSTEALDRIARDMPVESRFLITVRDPVERTVSHWKYLRKIGTTDLALEDALIAHPQIVEHSMFGKHVAAAIERLGAERVYVLSFEQLKADPAAFGAAMSAALAVPFRPDLPYADRILEAQAARNPNLVRLLRNAGWFVRRIGNPRIVSAIKSNPLTSKLLYTSARSETGPSGPLPETLARLAERFEQDQELLAEKIAQLQGAQAGAGA